MLAGTVRRVRGWFLRPSLCGTLAFMALAASASGAAIAQSGARPNIIFILCDDLGYGDVGVFFQNARARTDDRSAPWMGTPQIDALAAAGVQLRQHYCPAPVCAPSRASLLLGVTQGNANVRDNQFDKALADNHTLASVLKAAGYATAAIGKWGLQGLGGNRPAQWPGFPTKRGFDYFFGYARHKDGHEHYPKEGLYDGHKQVWDNERDVSSTLDKCYTADLWTARAKKWIADQRAAQPARPFFLYLAYDTPHAAQEYPATAYPPGGGIRGGVQWLGRPGHMINTAAGKIDSYAHPDYAQRTWDDDHNPATPEVPWPDVDKRYATAIRRIDDCVGDLRQLLRDLKIETNTFIVFSSDNGPSIESYIPHEPLRADFFNSFGPFDGIKRDCWEGGVRMPTLACWPAHLPAGAINNDPSGFWDWMPTFADLAGIPPPAITDGVSLLPTLSGRGEQEPSIVYVEYNHNGRTPNYLTFAPAHRNRMRRQMQVIRLGEFVGVRYDIKSESDPFEIYDALIDPQERRNLASDPAFAALQRRMHARALQARRPNASAPRPYDAQLVPAQAIPVVSGVAWRTYERPLPWVAKLEELKPSASGRARWPADSLLPSAPRGGALFSGFIKAPADGEYTFYLTATGGGLLRIHEATVIDADFGYRSGTELSGRIRLQAGLHPFRLYYRRPGEYVMGNETPAALRFQWTPPGGRKQDVPARAFFQAE